jgi:glycosyltransferase involved in cell wall biosynthesis
MVNNKLTVCYFGTYRAGYSRNQIMIEALQQNDVKVVECHEQLWQGIEDRVASVEGGWLKFNFWKRVVRAYYNLLRKFRTIGHFDVLIVGYPGQFDILFAKILSCFKRKPVVWDVFMSIYLIALERGLEDNNRLIVRVLRAWENFALRLPNILIIDTSEYANWFQKTYNISANLFKLVPTGADDRIYKPIESQSPNNEQFKVLYYGTFIPNHGVGTIIKTADLLSEFNDILFYFIGDGPDRAQCMEYVNNQRLNNCIFIDWLDQESLVKQMGQADIILGAFGTTPQSMMTIQNKVYEGLAVGRVVITGDSPAVRQAFIHRENIYTCKRANSEALAQAILTLYEDSDLRNEIATHGLDTFQENYSLIKNGKRFKNHLLSINRNN